MLNLEQFCEQLTGDIQRTYEQGVTLDEAERLAAKFLHAQIRVANELAVISLDARMRKSGLKAVRAAVRTEEVKRHDKKPTESALEDALNLNPLVQKEQEGLDKSEESVAQLENYFSIFSNAHIYFRGVSKGRFE